MNDNSLISIDFEVVTVDSRGQIIARQTRTARQFTEKLDGGILLETVAIPAGTFLMGSPSGQGYADEHPQHRVGVPAFFMAKYPVIQEQWQAVMRSSPPYRDLGPKRPSDRISWHTANQFCERLAEQTGRPYRLPSEAEWEYACRAGTTTPFYFGETLTTDLANYVGEFTYASEPEGVYRHETTDAGSFPANAFGLHDMHGNVWEWCAGPWTENYETVGSPGQEKRTYRVLRGGCWHDPPDLCRSAIRLRQVLAEAEDYFGFRVALSRR